MFCTKCGFNAGNAKFCPKCGTPLTVAVAQTPVAEPVAEPAAEQVAEPAAEQVAESVQPQVQPIQFGQPQQQTAQFNQPQQNQFDSMPFGGQPVQPQMQAPKKKKKWPKVVAIVVAIVIILGIGGYFAYPYIAEMISPKKQAVTALKNAGSDMQELFTDSVESLTNSSVSTSTKQQMKGSYKLNAATIDGMNYMSYLKADTINYDVQADTTTQTISGTVGLASGSSANIINVQFYTDMNYLYFKVPELFSESFKVSMSTLGYSSYSNNSISSSLSDLSSISSMFGTFDTSTISQYSDVIEAVVKDAFTGFDKMVEKCAYKKTGTSTYQSENGDFKVSTYEVTLTKDALIEGCNAAIDAIYGDSKVSSYMSLVSTLTGQSKESIKSEITSSLSTMKDVPFTIYVNNDDKIVKAIFDVAAFGTGETGEVSVEFIGKDKLTDYIIAQAVIDDVTVKYSVKINNNVASIACDIIPDQLTNKNEFLKMSFDLSSTGTSFSMKNLVVQGNIDGESFDVGMSAEAAVSSFGAMTLTSSSFKNAIDPTYMTSAQQVAIGEELIKNVSVLKKVVSDTLYNQLTNSLGLGKIGSSL